MCILLILTCLQLVTVVVRHLATIVVCLKPHFSPPTGTMGPVTNGATVGISVATATVVAFIIGVLAGALLFYCISKHQSQQQFKPEPPFHQEQKIVSSSNPLQQTVPEYEEVITLRKNIVYESTQTCIEMCANEAYGPMHH